MFSVKLAYKVALNLLTKHSRREIGYPSGKNSNHHYFSWGSYMAPTYPRQSATLHLEGSAYRSLPFRPKLKRRGVQLDDTICPVCKCIEEDGGNCFFKCKPVKHLWKILQLEELRLVLKDCQRPTDVISIILKLDTDQCIRACTLMLWLWWHERVNEGISKQ
ncbi:hypothetical protein BRADI_3g21294v3 [Brachypodium distachyon]|uniref:Reverse transcriptase zinc-binding domain-containing protein n=1 Tax=Brachypodium distachyon TaxID=15368 RepID=A0A2K2CYL7_BRADI|nr:hypothetical protein BRADI_3g21294v3 [Brachypodium distachyon]